MYNPISTYRLQFHKEFTLKDLESIIAYLSQLGIRTVYASPLFAAVAGSTHGYDGIDPSVLNPEIGTEEELRSLKGSLKEKGIGWLQDIVPNHQAFDVTNPWLFDVLEKGQHSVYANFFDIDWSHPVLRGKLLVPFLGQKLEELSARGQLRLTMKDKRIYLQTGEQLYPVGHHTYQQLFAGLERKEPGVFADLKMAFEKLHAVEDSSQYNLLWTDTISRMDKVLDGAQNEHDIMQILADLSNEKETMLQIAHQQNYLLSYWEETDTLINYRRFFTVNGLISLNADDEEVFSNFHRPLLQFVKDGVFDGLRIDHIDGLYDPKKYLHNLREETGSETFIVVEKILGSHEDVPLWPVQGNTGYDFLVMVNNLLTCKKNEEIFRKKYAKFSGGQNDAKQLQSDKKRAILHKHMAGDLDNLFRLFCGLDPGYTSTLNLQEKLQFKSAIGEMLVACPVYRYYPDKASDAEVQEGIRQILSTIENDFPALQKVVFQLREMLLVRTLGLEESYNAKALHFLRRCMQFTGPLMAKGIEDTLMYSYTPFLAHNEVGDDVEAFGITPSEFHQMMAKRLAATPLSLNATSTHDTKRGEDSRARLNVLSEIPAEWFNAVKSWRNINRELTGRWNIHPDDEYFIYQVIVGAYPFPGESRDGFLARLQQYLIKSLREGKERSSWNLPDAEYEENVQEFLRALLAPENPFINAANSFLQKVVDFGIINSLSQLVLKFCCPGTPDVYQGAELWDLSLVDPDNRRPVDFEVRLRMLEATLSEFAVNPVETLKTLWQERNTGRIKLFLTHQLLQFRNEEAGIFADGDYIPLKVKGKYEKFVFAFARVHRSTWYVIAVPLYSALRLNGQVSSISDFDWKNTRIVLPEEAPRAFTSMITNGRSIYQDAISMNDLFKDFPVSILKLEPVQKERSAGILLSVSSLPSKFGSGDLGPAAYNFVDALRQSRQKYWQILPLNPVSRGNGYGPYSSYSSLGGNTLLISPQALVEAGLLSEADLDIFPVKNAKKSDFEKAEELREILFDKAFDNFLAKGERESQDAYQVFCAAQHNWLHDHAMYMALKNYHQGKSWKEWEEPFRMRDDSALEDFAHSHSRDIEREKWLQYTFDSQFSALKKYCEQFEIRLIGDLPFYVAFDSADVWANREIFELDANGELLGMAGVPPDYFNSQGQLWGMPVFRWEKLRESGYTWWLNRIKRNLEFVELLRLDHFRAFAGYWRVKPGETTAINGSWEPGPGKKFFDELKKEFPQMPFIAEDLGEITPDVYELRDQFGLPGMRVLQFAFGDDMGTSVHSPHNYEKHAFVYTGTHDNNTSKGWFRKDASKKNRKNLSIYAGAPVNESNVHLAMIRTAHASVAETVIVPIQDILALDESARMNTPAVADEQWTWKLLPGQFNDDHIEQLKKWTRLYNRE